METSTSSSNIVELEGDLFDAPDGAALIHACNCFGSWGGGIALAFRKKYPAAFEIYQSHCRTYRKNPKYLDTSEAAISSGPITRSVLLLEGSALIIPPQRRDYERRRGKKHWIICLFTSRGYGRQVSGFDVILQNTELALIDLKEQLNLLQSRELGPENVGIQELCACRFNSGLFGVDWIYTRELLHNSGLEVTVVRPPGE